MAFDYKKALQAKTFDYKKAIEERQSFIDSALNRYNAPRSTMDLKSQIDDMLQPAPRSIEKTYGGLDRAKDTLAQLEIERMQRDGVTEEEAERFRRLYPDKVYTPPETPQIIDPTTTEKTLPYLGEKAKMGLYSVGAGIQGLRDVFSPPEFPEGAAYSTKPEALQKRFWDEYGRQTVEFAQVEAENVKGIKKFAGDTVQAITQMIPTILLGAAGSSAVGLGMLGMSAAGNAAQQALKEGATQEKALAYGLLIGGIEAATESIVGGLPFMKGVGDKAIEGILKPVKSNVVRALANRVIDAGGEALEEIIAGSLDPVAKRITYDKDAKFPKLSELAYEGGVGFAVSAVLGVLPTVQDVFKYKNIDEAFNAAVETVESLPDGYKSKTMPRGDKEAFVKQVQEDFTEHATRVGNGLANLIEGKTDYGLPIAPEGEIVYGEDRSGVSFKPAEQPSIEAPSQLQEIQPVPDEKETSSVITPETQETDSTALQANTHRHNIELSGVSSSNGLTVKIKFRIDRYVDDPEAIGQKPVGKYYLEFAYKGQRVDGTVMYDDIKQAQDAAVEQLINANSVIESKFNQVVQPEAKPIGEQVTDSEVVPETQDKSNIIKRAKEVFGTTVVPSEAGYILEDGSMLDLSDKREGGTPGRRNLDHREVQVLYEDLEQTEAMNKFIIDTNSVRVGITGKDNENLLVDIVTDIPLSEKQINRIKSMAARKNNVTIDFYKTDNLNTPYLSKNLEFPKVSDIDKALKEVIATTSTPSETKLTMAEKEAIAMQKAEEAQAKMETALPGKTGVAKDNEGNEIAFIYKVVDANDLIASHNTNMYENPVYPSELQPRDRTRIASALQVENIIKNLQPEFLGENIKITDGAPIVGSDGIVESGNGRIIALQKMYETNHANSEKYINWLRNNAETFGIDPYNMPSNPVLVRERTTDVDRVAFTRKANESSIAQMSATETAASDAAKIDSRLLDMFVTNETGVINSYANRDFISGWLNRVIPPNERGRYITNEGALSQEGLLRLKNAIFYKAYENPAIMAKFSESLDSNVKNITNAMLSLAPKFVSVKEQIQKGSLHNLDYSKDLADAAELYVRIRDRGQSVDEYLAQGNLFGDEVPAIVKDILYILENNKRSAKAINRFFAYVLDHVVKLGDPNQISIYGTVPTYNKVDVLEAIIRRLEDEGREQISLFPEAEVEVFQAGREEGTRDIADIRTERQGEVDVQRDAREKPRDDTGTESQAAQETTLRNAMRNLAGDGAESLNATVTTTNTLEQRQLQNLLNELGINVVFYEADTPIPVNGFHDPLLSDTIFIRASETRNMAWATGHEFFHSLKANHADLHRAVLSIYKDTITTEQKEKFLKTFDKLPQHQEALLKDENLLIEEILADEAGNVFTSQEFWERVNKKNPNLFQRIIQIVRDFFKRFKRLEVNNYLTTEQIERFEKDFETIVTAVRGRVETGEKRPAAATTRYTAREVERKPAPPFFSKLQQVITEKMPNTANASDVRNLVNKSGIKADEIKWSGINEFLSNKLKVSKAELLDFLRMNELQIEEVIKRKKWQARLTGPRVEYFDTKEAAQRAIDAENEWIENESVYVDADAKEGIIAVFDHNNKPIIEIEKYDDGLYEIVLNVSASWGYEEGPFSNFRSALRFANEMAREIRASWRSEVSTEPMLYEGDKDAAQYSKWTLPGGENYRELLFILPSSETYKSSHWDEKNVLAHVRFNDRTDADGNKVLFIEEIQSDWHQEGRKKGYKGTPETLPADWTIKEENGTWTIYDEDGHWQYKGTTKEQVLKEYADTMEHLFPKVPDAPFAKTWHEFVLKRMLRYAAENGYDTVAWTTGEQQADRYDLSKYVSKVRYAKDVMGTYYYDVFDHEGKAIHEAYEASPTDIENFLGKEIAQRIISGEATETDGDYSVLSGLDLKVGGEGMKGFYDRILPQFLDKYAKKWGTKVESSEISTETTEGGSEFTEQPSIDITPAMKESVMYEGQPLFTARKGEERLPSREVKPQYDERVSTEGREDFRKDYRGEFHTVSKAEKPAFDLKKFINNIYDKTFNTLEEINRLGKKYGQKPSEGMYSKALATRRTAKQARIIATQRLIDAEGNTIGKSLLEVLAPLQKDKSLMNVFDDYLVYKHAPSWMEKGRKVFADDLNLTTEDVKKRAADIERDHPEFVQMHKDLMTFQRQLAKAWLVDTGIISKETFQKLTKEYPNYVPLMRRFEDVEQKGRYRPKSGYVDQKSPIKRAKGSERDIISPIESILEHIDQYTRVAKRNEAGQAFLDLIRENRQEMEDVARELWPEIIAVGAPGQEVVTAQILDSNGKPIDTIYFEKVVEEDGLDGVMETLTRLYEFQDSAKRKDKGKIVTVLKDGKPVHIEVYDENLLDALMSITPRQQLTITKAMGTITRVMKNLTTGLNLSFGLARNLWHDLITGYVSSKTMGANPFMYFKYLADITAAMGDIMASGMEGKKRQGSFGKFVNEMAEHYRKYQNMGGGAFASPIAADAPHLKRAKQAVLGKRNLFSDMINVLEVINNTLESAPRLAEFKRVIKQEGDNYKGRLKAIYEADDLTVNFSRFGEDVKALDSFVPFLNPAVQGVDKTVRIFKDNPIRAILKGIYAVTIPSILVWCWNHRDDEVAEEYNRLSSYMKDNYFCWSYRDSEGVKFLKIPKGRQIGIIFGALPERLLDMYAKHEPDAFKDYVDSVLQTWMPPNPVTDNIAFPAFRSMVLGKNWRFQDLETYAEKLESPRYRYNEATSGVAKSIGDVLNVSPKRIDDFFRSYFGGIAQFGIPLTSEKGGSIDKTFIQQVTADPVYSTDSLNNFYELRNRLAQQYNDYKVGNGNMTNTEYGIYEQLNKVSSILSKYRKAINNTDDTVKKRELRKAMSDIAIDVYDKAMSILREEKTD